MLRMSLLPDLQQLSGRIIALRLFSKRTEKCGVGGALLFIHEARRAAIGARGKAACFTRVQSVVLLPESASYRVRGYCRYKDFYTLPRKNPFL